MMIYFDIDIDQIIKNKTRHKTRAKITLFTLIYYDFNDE